ncbi:hypothetical protein ACIGO6_10260 [Streptomyces sp. NPDC053750]|uniref:hypothetical protein n=1 Tax=Streptomyces sp. NPDC053750 TaxID=3365714 RepID=UPI0037D080DF
MIHAPGENRTGNNYWQAQTARRLASAGITVARFDLAGYGESLADKDLSVWDRQIAEAVSTARSYDASAVHVTARGLHAALLPDSAPGLRVAVFPPEPRDLDWWGQNAGRSGTWEARSDAPADEVSFWAACGVETNLLGGLTAPICVLDELVRRMCSSEAAPGWDLTLCTEEGRTADPSRMIAGRQGLARLEADRHGLQDVLHNALMMWPRQPGPEGAE